MIKISHEILTKHLLRMTDSTGLFQHSKYGIPNFKEGYTTDDNSRALIFSVLLYEHFKQSSCLELMYIYASFMMYAQNEDGTFKNFMNYSKTFIDNVGSEDCFGRCIWSLCTVLSNSYTPKNIKQICRDMLYNALPNIFNLSFIRAKCYCVIGLCNLLSEAKLDINIQKYMELIHSIESYIYELYIKNSDSTWKWPEPFMTYSNAVIPWALFKIWELTKDNQTLKLAQDCMDFLFKNTFNKNYFKPIGCSGWLTKGNPPSKWDEQPIETSETVLACIDAYKCTGQLKFFDMADKCMGWYAGINSKKCKMIDEETLGCYDGITVNGPNLNQGAESIVTYGIATLSWDKLKAQQLELAIRSH